MSTLIDEPRPVEDDLEHDHERLLELERHVERSDLRQTLTTLFAFLALGAAVTAATLIIAFGGDDSDEPATTAAPAQAGAAPAPGAADAGNAERSEGAGNVIVEPYKRPDPTLPAVPPGAVKKFRVDVYEHVTKVSKDLPATRVWSYAVNGKFNRGTGVSEPMVVEQGDKVEITLVNGADKAMDVRMPHSIDYHSSEIAPNKAFKTIKPGQTHRFSFVAKHPGVYMYHCATDPVLTHTGAGMVGMMVVKPKNLAPVDRELWITQQEYYVGKKPGAELDPDRLAKKDPNVIAFNGFAAQYKQHPIAVKKGETIRMYVLNAGPSIWSAFHVIGTVFDKTVTDNGVARHVQTVNLAPSQGGWVEFTLDDEGNFPFVTHAFGDMVRGAVGVLATEKAPKAGGMKH